MSLFFRINFYISHCFFKTSSKIALLSSYSWSFATFASSLVSSTIWDMCVTSRVMNQRLSVSAGLSFLLQFNFQLSNRGSCYVKLQTDKTQKKKKKKFILTRENVGSWFQDPLGPIMGYLKYQKLLAWCLTGSTQDINSPVVYNSQVSLLCQTVNN